MLRDLCTAPVSPHYRSYQTWVMCHPGKLAIEQEPGKVFKAFVHCSPWLHGQQVNWRILKRWHCTCDCLGLTCSAIAYKHYPSELVNQGHRVRTWSMGVIYWEFWQHETLFPMRRPTKRLTVDWKVLLNSKALGDTYLLCWNFAKNWGVHHATSYYFTCKFDQRFCAWLLSLSLTHLTLVWYSAAQHLQFQINPDIFLNDIMKKAVSTQNMTNPIWFFT